MRKRLKIPVSKDSQKTISHPCNIKRIMKHDRKIIYLAGFLFSLSVALMSYINSSFLSSFVGEKLVGIIYTIGSIISILALLIAPQIFRKIGGYRFLLLVIGLDALSILSFVLTKN